MARIIMDYRFQIWIMLKEMEEKRITLRQALGTACATNPLLEMANRKPAVLAAAATSASASLWVVQSEGCRGLTELHEDRKLLVP